MLLPGEQAAVLLQSLIARRMLHAHAHAHAAHLAPGMSAVPLQRGCALCLLGHLPRHSCSACGAL